MDYSDLGEPPRRLDFKKNRVRSFFLSFDTIPNADVNKQETQLDLIQSGLRYIQMRMPLEKITPEYEAKLKEKVEKHVVQAKIREAKEEDLDRIVYIHNRSFMTSGENFMPLTIDAMRELFNLPDVKIFIGKVYGMDSAFVILDFEGPNKEYGVIAGMGVLPEYQKKGLGKVLGIAAWNYFRQKNVKELRCEVFFNNKTSYYFIKSLGFEEYETKVYKMDDFVLDPPRKSTNC